MDYFISLELEKTLSTCLLVHLAVSSALNCIALYCLLRETPPNQRAVRSYLLAIQVILFLFDLVMDVLIEFMPLLPVPGGYFLGFLPRAGVPLQAVLGVFVCVAAALASSIVLCFLHKHQTIIDSSNRFKLSKTSYNLIRSFYFFPSIVCIIMVLCWQFDTQSSDRAMMTYPFNICWIKERGEYLVLEKTSITRIASLLFITIALMSIIATNLAFWHIFHFLHSMRAGRSISTNNKVKRSVVALYVQLFAPSFFLGIPLLIIFAGFATDTISFTTSLVLYWTMPLHSPVHSLILLSITPSYRAFLYSFVMRCTNTNRSHVSQVSTAKVDYRSRKF